MSRIFPVQRTTNRVLTSPSPSPPTPTPTPTTGTGTGTYTPLGRFLADHFDAKTYLDADVVHNPEHLFTSNWGVLPLPNSCGGSVEATSDDSLLVRFRPSALPPPSLLLETKAKRRADETDAWVRGLEEVRRARRTARRGGNVCM